MGPYLRSMSMNGWIRYLITTSKRHALKNWEHLFQPMWDRSKTFDLRLNDRDYQIGDHVTLQEFNIITREHTGRSIQAEITYVTQNDRTPCAFSPVSLADEYCVISYRHYGNWNQ
jgi:hypothetical protein